MDYDLIIRKPTIVDGTGAPRYEADIAVSDWNALFALLRSGKLRLEGDLHPFMTHLFWFKGVCLKLREAGW